MAPSADVVRRPRRCAVTDPAPRRLPPAGRGRSRANHTRDGTRLEPAAAALPSRMRARGVAAALNTSPGSPPRSSGQEATPSTASAESVWAAAAGCRTYERADVAGGGPSMSGMHGDLGTAWRPSRMRHRRRPSTSAARLRTARAPTGEKLEQLAGDLGRLDGERDLREPGRCPSLRRARLGDAGHSSRARSAWKGRGQANAAGARRQVTSRARRRPGPRAAAARLGDDPHTRDRDRQQVVGDLSPPLGLPQSSASAAAGLTGGGAGVPDRPRGRSGLVTTAATSTPASTNAVRAATATSGVPKNAMRSAASAPVGAAARRR